jgi:hypothetical protein
VSVNKITGLENWMPTEENISHSEGATDFFMLVHSYIDVLSELIKDETIKEMVHVRIDIIFQSIFSSYVNFTIQSISWI